MESTSSLVPLKYFEIFSLVPQNQNLNFLCFLFPKITFVPFIFRPEINGNIPLFPITPERAS